MEWKNFISPIFLQDSFPQSLLKFPTSHLLEVLLPTVGKTQWAEQRTRLTKPSSPFKLLLSTCFIRIVSSMHTANRTRKDWASEKKKKKKWTIKWIIYMSKHLQVYQLTTERCRCQPASLQWRSPFTPHPMAGWVGDALADISHIIWFVFTAFLL